MSSTPTTPRKLTRGQLTAELEAAEPGSLALFGPHCPYIEKQHGDPGWQNGYFGMPDATHVRYLIPRAALATYAVEIADDAAVEVQDA